MRLDKFLKVTRVIKRRTIATEVIKAGGVMVNEDVKKASYEVKQDDIIKVHIYDKIINLKVLQIPKNNVKKEEVEEYITII